MGNPIYYEPSPCPARPCEAGGDGDAHHPRRQQQQRAPVDFLGDWFEQTGLSFPHPPGRPQRRDGVSEGDGAYGAPAWGVGLRWGLPPLPAAYRLDGRGLSGGGYTALADGAGGANNGAPPPPGADAARAATARLRSLDRLRRELMLSALDPADWDLAVRAGGGGGGQGIDLGGGAFFGGAAAAAAATQAGVDAAAAVARAQALARGGGGGGGGDASQPPRPYARHLGPNNSGHGQQGPALDLTRLHRHEEARAAAARARSRRASEEEAERSVGHRHPSRVAQALLRASAGDAAARVREVQATLEVLEGRLLGLEAARRARAEAGRAAGRLV